jgi:hypothetical protein
MGRHSELVKAPKRSVSPIARLSMENVHCRRGNSRCKLGMHHPYIGIQHQCHHLMGIPEVEKDADFQLDRPWVLSGPMKHWASLSGDQGVARS